MPVTEVGKSEEALTGLVRHVIKKHGKGVGDLSQAVQLAVSDAIERSAGQIAADVTKSVLGERDVVVLTDQEAVNRNVADVLRDLGRGRQFGNWGSVIRSLFSSDRRSDASCKSVWGNIDLQDDGKLLEAAQIEVLKLRLRITTLEGCLRGHEIGVPREENSDGVEYDLFSDLKKRARGFRHSRRVSGSLFEDQYDDGDFDDEEEVEPRSKERFRGRREHRKSMGSTGTSDNAEAYEDEDFDSTTPSSHRSRTGADAFFKNLEKMQGQLAELQASLEKAVADREKAEQNRDEAKEESKGLRALLARKETKITLLERADTMVPELEESMREVMALRARLNGIVKAVRDGLDEKEPLGFFEFAEIERVMDECAALIKKIDDALVINFEGYVDASSLYAEVLSDIALNDGIPNSALFRKVSRLNGMLLGVLSFQNQFLREQAAERMANKEVNKTVEVPPWWGWKAPDAGADEECALIDFMSLLGVEDLEALKAVVKEGDTGKIRRKVLRSALKKFHPDILLGQINSAKVEGFDSKQALSEATAISQLLAKIEKALLSDIKVLEFYLELYAMNSQDDGMMVTWEQIYPAMAAFLCSREPAKQAAAK